MNDYKELAQELINNWVADCLQWAKDNGSTVTRREILEQLQDDTQDVFGNMSGSRTYSTYDAEQFINKSNAVFDTDIADLYASISDTYLSETLARGAETFDVVTLELIAPEVINEMLEGLA